MTSKSKKHPDHELQTTFARKPPPTAAEFRDMVEGSIKEMGLVGPEAAAFRQKYRKWTHPYDYRHIDPPKPEVSDEEKTTIARRVEEQLGLDMGVLEKRMGLKK